MCTLFANLYVLLTWGPHMVYMGTQYIFVIYMIRCGWLGSIGIALETRQSHTIEYGVSKIVPEGHREGNKSPVVLQGSAARRCISVPMCDQSTSCNQRWRMPSRESTIKWVHWVTPDLIKHRQDWHGTTMRNVTLKHTPVRNRAPLTLGPVV